MHKKSVNLLINTFSDERTFIMNFANPIIYSKDNPEDRTYNKTISDMNGIFAVLIFFEHYF